MILETGAPISIQFNFVHSVVHTHYTLYNSQFTLWKISLKLKKEYLSEGSTNSQNFYFWHSDQVPFLLSMSKLMFL